MSINHYLDPNPVTGLRPRLTDVPMEDQVQIDYMNEAALCRRLAHLAAAKWTKEETRRNLYHGLELRIQATLSREPIVYGNAGGHMAFNGGTSGFGPARESYVWNHL